MSTRDSSAVKGRYELRPPYVRERPWARHCSTPHGTLVVLEVSTDRLERSEASALSTEIRALRRESLAAVVLRLEMESSGALLPLLTNFSFASMPDLVPKTCRATGVATAVRRPHARRITLPRTWLRCVDHRLPVAERLKGEITSIVRTAHAHRGVEELLRSERLAPRTVRAHFRRGGLPSPRKWFLGARLIHGQSWLLADPDLTPGAVAARLSYASAHSMSNVMHRVFGVTAVSTRRLLGVEWRIAAWLEWARGAGDQR